MDSCCEVKEDVALSRTYRRVLWIALAVNAGMFIVEVLAGFAAGSVSLQADALDFFGDAANYAISLSVLSMALVWRARAALFKGLTMGAFQPTSPDLSCTVSSCSHGSLPRRASPSRAHNDTAHHCC